MNLPVPSLTVARTVCGCMAFGTSFQRSAELFFSFLAICTARFVHRSHFANRMDSTTIHASDLERGQPAEGQYFVVSDQ